MHDEPDPPRRYYRFKDREFERVNPPAGTVSDPGAIDLKDLYRTANATRPGLEEKPQAASASENEVHAILRENHARAEAAGLNAITKPAERKTKRFRDYLFVMLAGNLFFISNFPFNPVFAGAGFVLFNVGVTWIMWVVMDNY